MQRGPVIFCFPLLLSPPVIHSILEGLDGFSCMPMYTVHVGDTQSILILGLNFASLGQILLPNLARERATNINKVIRLKNKF